MRLPDKLGPIHFIGIGGIGMSGIAEVLLNLGYKVQGSDAAENANVARLRAKGALIHTGHNAAHLGTAEVVVGSTFSACIPALIDAAERDRDLRRFHHRFQKEARRPLVGLIADGVAHGDFRADTDPELAALALLGVIFYRRLMSGDPFDPEHARELVAAVLGPP